MLTRTVRRKTFLIGQRKRAQQGETLLSLEVLYLLFRCFLSSRHGSDISPGAPERNKAVWSCDKLGDVAFVIFLSVRPRSGCRPGSIVDVLQTSQRGAGVEEPFSLAEMLTS